jgi:hypothetical protein
VTTTEQPKRARRTVETADFCAMMSRMIRAHRKRVAAGSAEDLADLVALRAELDEAINEGAQALHDSGLSWTEIAAALGVSRQAARQRFGGAA